MAEIVIREPRPGEAAAIAAVLNEWAAAYGGQPVTVSEVEAWSAFSDTEARVVERDGLIVAYGDVSGGADPRVELTVPPYAGDVSEALLHEVEDLARARAATGATLRTTVVHGEDVVTLLEASGYSPAGHSIQMEADLDELSPSPDWPAGVAVRTADGERDIELAYALQNETFADQDDFRRTPVEDWRRWMLRAGFDPSLWFFADAGGDTVGICLCHPERAGDAELGWVSVIGVVRAWRGRGVALALLRHAFRELRGRGKRRLGLGVDAANPTGAVRLYERVGMRVVRRHDHYAKTVP